MPEAPTTPLLLGPADHVGPAAKAKRARALAEVGRTRVENFLPRLVASGITAVIAVAILGSVASLIWFAGLAALIVADRNLYAQLKRRCEEGDVPDNVRGMIAWTFTQSAYGNLLAPALWFAPYVHGESLAVIYIISGLGNAATSLRAHQPLAIAGLAPTILVFLGCPVADYIMGGGRTLLDLIPLIGGALFLAFGVNLWRSLVASDEAQVRAEAAAMRERQAAAAAAAAKSDAIRRMRDEVRTPMTALLGAAEHLKRAAQSAEARRHIAMLVQASDVLRLVLDDLTDLDRLENGQMKVAPKAADPREVATGVVAAFRAAAHDKGLELFLDIDPSTPTRVDIDPLRVRQVLFNLVANAVRYTTHGGVRVVLHAEATETPDRARLVFAVSDTGHGMSRSQMAIIFGRGRVCAPGHEDGQGHGPGLGLSISLRLARLMGGRLGVTSEIGEGSVFTFTLDAPLSAGLKGRSAA